MALIINLVRQSQEDEANKVTSRGDMALIINLVRLSQSDEANKVTSRGDGVDF